MTESASAELTDKLTDAVHDASEPTRIRLAYVYARRMSDVIPDRPKRKAMFLSPEALRNLRATSSRRRTEREAMEEALELLAQRDTQRDAMAAFVTWAHEEWGPPTDGDRQVADEIWAAR